MASEKRVTTIPATELQPGDSFSFVGDPVVYRVTCAVAAKGDVSADINFRDPMEVGMFRDIDESTMVTVGYTNRRAKRQRGKIRRRARKAARS